jgi:hypothetical protein
MLNTISKLPRPVRYLAYLLLAFGVYCAIAWITFQLRNPCAGEGAFFASFAEVISFEADPRYNCVGK